MTLTLSNSGRNTMNNSTRMLALAAAGVLTLSACGGGEGFEDTGGDAAEGSQPPASAEGPAALRMLIGSSGDAETNAVTEAAQAWADETGNTVEVTVASDLNQELAQGFAGGSPADVFYLDAQSLADNAKAGNLYAYEAENNEDFYEPLRNSFTYDGQQWCAPKDFSTLGLVINQQMWEEAGLTEDDIPTTYDELGEVAGTLTTDEHVGLVLGPGIDRAGAFVVGNGGWWLNEDNTEPTANTPEVLGGLQYVQDLMKEGSATLSSQVDAGWGGEAFGTGKGAMTVEGNWIKGAMANDYPDVEYTVAELPEGPAGPGTLLFTVCWGIAADSPNQAQAVDLVNHLTAPEQQMAFAEAFGVMPSRQSVAADYESAFPEDAAFIAGGEYGHGPVNAPAIKPVVDDLNSTLESFEDADLEAAVEDFDTNAASVLAQ
jgi:multiple sugar transport system substrate-binding protein